MLLAINYLYLIVKKQTIIDYTITSMQNLDKSPKGVFNQAWRMIKNNYVDKSLNHQDWKRWKKRYEDNIETYDDAHLAIQTMIESLDDPYTRFLSREEFKEQGMNIDSKLQGIGVHITEIAGRIFIISIIEESPAQKYGLKEKDEILKVNGDSVKGLSLSKVAELIRGEKGTSVKLSLLRDDKTITKYVTRDEIKIKTVKTKKLENNITYIKITSFISLETASEFKKALSEAKDASGVIIDVRGNYGGLLTNAIYISNMFLEQGNIVSIVNRNGEKDNFDAQSDYYMTKKPAIVLVDEASASASEIFSGALKDNHRAKLVGERTFGKGKVQMIQKLVDDSGINITVAKYLTPAGIDIDHKGVKPDYFVKTDSQDYFKSHKEDLCLSKAIELLNNKISLK